MILLLHDTLIGMCISWQNDSMCCNCYYSDGVVMPDLGLEKSVDVVVQELYILNSKSLCLDQIFVELPIYIYMYPIFIT